jgi:AraC-like DNA-binding protein
MPNPWMSSVDPLGEALHFLRMDGVFYCRSEFTAPWALALPAMPDCMMFHFVTVGRCWVDVEAAEPRLLQPGDLALVPHGRGHRLEGELGLVKADKLFELPRELVSDRYEILRLGGGGTPSTVVCGAVRFEHPAAYQLIQLLPRVIIVEAHESSQAEWIQSTLRFMALEAREMRPGGETVITRLADILVVQAIRAWLDQDPAAQTGWLGALQDRQVGRAIAMIHREPGREWTVESLASEVAMSRSGFAARFTQLVGEPAMHYVARWRMHVALTMLKDDDAPLAELAERLGYQSEAAFSRAFKRFIGVSPGAARRKAAAIEAELASRASMAAVAG